MPDHPESLRYFNMLVYKNGSLARQHVRDEYYNKSWPEFDEAVEKFRPKNPNDLPKQASFWWLLPDIIPAGASGTFKYISNRGDASSEMNDALSAEKVKELPDGSEAVAILESQLLNYRSRSSAILESSDTPSRPSTPNATSSNPRLARVYATGGASANKAILSLMADVLNAPVCKNVEYNTSKGEWEDANWNACSVGTAYKARWGWERHVAQGDRKWIGFDDLVKECRDARKARRAEKGKEQALEEEGIKVAAQPGPGAAAYERSVEWWKALEARALKGI